MENILMKLTNQKSRLVAEMLIGLLAATFCYSSAQVKLDDRLQPAMHTAIGRIPKSGLSEKELYKQWRKTQDSKNLKKIQRNQIHQKLFPETVLLDEGFEGGTFPPSGWTNVVVTGDPDWVQSSTSPHTDVFSAYSEFSSGPPSEKYLITKRVTLNGLLLYRLTFWIQRGFTDPFDPDTVYIKLSTVDSLPGNFTTTLYKCYTGPDTSTNPNIYTTTYKQFSVEFSGIAGTAWLAFDHEDTFGQSIFLDDISLEEIVNNDINAFTVDEPSSGARKNLGIAFQPKATYKNNGVLTQTSIPVRFKIINSEGTVVYNNTQTIATLAPNISTQVTFSSFTPSVPGNYTARALTQNSGDTNPTNDSTDVPFRVPDDIAGIKTVGIGGNITTLFEAVRFLDDNNVAGPLTFSLISTSYAESPLPIDQIHYTTTQQPVIFKPSNGVSSVVTISATPSSPYGFRIKGAGNLTFDGSNSGSTTRNLTLVIDTTGFFAPGILLTDGCKNVTVKNLIVQGYSKSDGSANSAIVIDSTTTGKKDSNIVFNNLQLLRAFNGFFLHGPSAKSFKVTISNCDFGGSASDAITQAGVVAYNVDSLLISTNNIKNLYRSQGIIDLYGIFLGSECTNSIISSNNIHAIKNVVNSYFAHGLVNNAGSGSNLLCYNNFIYDILSQGSGTGSNFTVGLYSRNPANTGEKYYYNSIFLYGHDSSTSANSLSAGFALENGASSMQIKNNIIFNSMTFTGSSTGNKAYCIYTWGSVWPGGSSSSNNDLYTSGPQGVIGFINSVNRISLSNWQAATSQDGNSISSDPLFTSSNDLHIQIVGVSSPVNGLAAPIAGITDDIDNENRNSSTPDIGADEFTPQSGITVSMLSGWNLISLPTTLPDLRKTIIFPTAISDAFAYEGTYVAKDTLIHGVGYWLKFESEQNVPIMGTLVTKDTVDVVDGWNMIGAISQPIKTSSVMSIPSGLITSPFFRYNETYLEADTIKPGGGYWVKVNQPGSLILSASPTVSLTSLIRIIPTSERPPFPPDGAFEENEFPKEFSLEQAYPNPFNPNTKIKYALPVDAIVKLSICNILGQEVRVIVEAIETAGYQSKEWNASDLASGIYFYRLEATSINDPSKSFTEVKKMLLLK